MFALDTNSVVHFFQGRGRVAERLLAAAPRAIAVPSVVVYELSVGVERSARSTP
jgi:tRNA(fMet)-specific endonuclease VapC